MSKEGHSAPRNITFWGGEELTGRNISGDFKILSDSFSPTAHAEIFTTQVLAAGATYISSPKDFEHSRLGFMSVLAFSNQAGTLYIDQSMDGSNWDFTENVSVSANVGTKLKSAIIARYARVRYVNGATAQTIFRLGGRYTIS